MAFRRRGRSFRRSFRRVRGMGASAMLKAFAAGKRAASYRPKFKMKGFLPVILIAAVGAGIFFFKDKIMGLFKKG